MNKKIIITAIVLFIAWYIFFRNKIEVPKQISFNGSTFKLQRSENRSDARLGYYVVDGESVEQFSNLIMVTAWPKNSLSVSDFDTRFREAFLKGLQGKLGADNDVQGSCWVITTINPSQTVHLVYKETSKARMQISLTQVREKEDSSDAPSSCKDHDSVAENLSSSVS